MKKKNQINKILVVGTTRSGTTYFATSLQTETRPYIGEISNVNQKITSNNGTFRLSPVSKTGPLKSRLKNREKNFFWISTKPFWIAKWIINHTYKGDQCVKDFKRLANHVDKIVYCKRDIIDIILSKNNVYTTNVWNHASDQKLESEKKDIEWKIPDSEIELIYKRKLFFEDMIYNQYQDKLISFEYKNDLSVYNEQIKELGGSAESSISKLNTIEQYKNNYNIVYDLDKARSHIRNVLKECK